MVAEGRVCVRMGDGANDQESHGMGLRGVLRVVVIMHVCAFAVLEHCQYFSGPLRVLLRSSYNIVYTKNL
jgi:hypothetical protein